MSNDAKPDLLFHWLARVLCQLTDAATVAGEFWVFAEKKASSPQAGFKSGDTIRIEVDMDLNTVFRFTVSGSGVPGFRGSLLTFSGHTLVINLKTLQ